MPGRPMNPNPGPEAIKKRRQRAGLVGVRIGADNYWISARLAERFRRMAEKESPPAGED